MKVAVTGTPGTGKTTAVEQLETDLEVIHLNDVIVDEELTTGRDEKRESAIADIEAVAEWLDGKDDVLFESHLAHHFEADRVVVLRCHPEELFDRLEGRDESTESIEENVESEALDIVLSQAVENHGLGSVYEIESTNKSPEAVATAIAQSINGEMEPRAGDVSYIDYL